MISDDTSYSPHENLASELRRGVLVLAVLAQCRGVQYGYSLKQQLSVAGLDINEGTLYPLLRRLEGQGLLRSEWLVTEDRPRRYYTLSTGGAAVLEKLVTEWQELVSVVANVLPQEQLGKENKDI
ncbi:MAG: helix-turn-helix transcriptional regulator [Caldilineaceae bacterium]